MKLAVHDNSLETNAEVESQDFGIGDVSVVIEMLRKHLYEHRIRTLVQEYMCNGRDATREAKSNKRLIVSIPNDMSPVFKVRDFGPGITPHRMANVFIKYGASTKRGTNGQTGGFGIGAKSAWSYTDSFTIVSITGGKKRTYVAHIGVNNQGRMDMLSEVDTTEETGTEIQVAVKPSDCWEFRQSIHRAAYFWNENERPEFRGLRAQDAAEFHTTGLMIGKELELSVNTMPNFIGFDYNSECLLVIDGVPYPVGEKLVDKCQNLRTLLERVVGKAIIRIGNGVVEVSASRESVADSTATADALNEIALKCGKELKSHVVAQFKAAKTNTEWITTYKNLSKVAHVDEYSSFGGYKINRNAIESATFADIEVTHVSLKTKRRSNNRSLDREVGRWISLDNVDHVFLMDVDEPIITQNKRMREYLEKSNRVSIILLNAKETLAPDPKWVRPAPVDGKPPAIHPTIVKTSLAASKKTLTKIVSDFGAKGLSCLPYTPAVRVPKAKRDRTKEMFTIHECTGHGKSPNTTTIEKVETDARYTYLYVPFSQWDKLENEFNDLANYLDLTKHVLCAMTEDSIDMVSGCKHFKAYTDWKTNFKVDAKLLHVMKRAKGKNHDDMKLLNRSSVAIKDKHLAKMVTEYASLNVKLETPVPDTLMRWAKDDLADFIADDEKLTKLLKEEYSLIKAVSGNDWRVGTQQVDELIYYINAKAKGK